ncbi:MAG: hypothetical protein KC420_08940, partial [Myxococcales bacterium]|nr:hypothetical protein [Myxococcales bacterium]
MRTHDLAPRHRGLRALRHLTLAALASALLPLTGCVITIGDHVGGHGGDDDFDAIEACYDDYEECVDDADGNALFIDACEGD